MTSHTEQPGHRTIKIVEKPDPSDLEREQRRKQAMALRPELVARIDQGIRERCPIKLVKR